MILLALQFMNSGQGNPLDAMVMWFGYTLVSSALTVSSEVVYLREQGYLKQYASLVIHPSAFIVSKGLVEFVVLFIGMFILLVEIILLQQHKLAQLLPITANIMVAALICYIPMVLLFIPIIRLRITRK